MFVKEPVSEKLVQVLKEKSQFVPITSPEAVCPSMPIIRGAKDEYHNEKADARMAIFHTQNDMPCQS